MNVNIPAFHTTLAYLEPCCSRHRDQ